MGINTNHSTLTSPITPTIAMGSNTSCSNSTNSRKPTIVMKSKTNQDDSTNLRTPIIAVGSNTNSGSSTRPRTPPIAMGSNSNPYLAVPRPMSPDRTISEEHLNYFRLPGAFCSCQQNSVVCHHRTAIYTTATIRELSGGDEAGSRYVPHSIVLNNPPPQPETYTTHLAILRNPKHQEWKSQPHKYLSPALSNISPHYVKRFVETSARAYLKQGIYPGRPEFTLSSVQYCELAEIKDKIAEFKTIKARRLEKELEREKRKQEEGMIRRSIFE
ncbi:0bb09c3e-26e6-4f12-9d1b-e65f28604387 [Sclerotinia trifoliorum]|uniref:0bb09c3e-26e6-4f12-9d1b-e65f28604387 n=1 Tax=Sclerotinia trifoliorum TaxID=28548 RepID=A0A8H2W3B7_9HELO|nr:0bb09c3e-26e6-4f12-9d1b-e65f28604387 [Sclerotinia trifoliorum]